MNAPLISISMVVCILVGADVTTVQVDTKRTLENTAQMEENGDSIHAQGKADKSMREGKGKPKPVPERWFADIVNRIEVGKSAHDYPVLGILGTLVYDPNAQNPYYLRFGEYRIEIDERWIVQGKAKEPDSRNKAKQGAAGPPATRSKSK